MFEQLLTQSPFWSQVGPSADVVMTTRVRLARNLPSLPFSSKMDETDISTLESIVHQAVVTSKYFENAQFVSLKDCSSDDRRFLRERDIITHEMELNNNSCVIFDTKQQYSILVNEEDHIRIQVIKPGLQMLLAFKLADEIDDELNKYISELEYEMELAARNLQFEKAAILRDKIKELKKLNPESEILNKVKT